MADDSEYGRPDGVLGSFAPTPEPIPAYTPPPPTVAPEAREAFGRPAGAGPYAPPASDRLAATAGAIRRRPVLTGLGRDVWTHAHRHRRGL